MARSDLDPKKLYEAYKRNPANQGLGSMFQEEGPGIGPSAGFLRRPGDMIATRGLADRIAKTRENYATEIAEDPNTAAAVEDYIADLRDADEQKKLGQLGGLGRALQKMRREQKGPNFRGPEDGLSELVRDQRRSAEAERMDVSRPDSPMTLGVGANELSPLDQIAEQLNNLSKPKPITGSGRGSVVEKPGERSQYNAEQAITNKMNADNLANLGTPDEDPEKVVEDTFMSGMNEVFNALQKPVPELGDRDELLQKYKDEFAEATGINIDGKPDKSQALMAMGLALMQNRAGKGFNVGKIFNAIGEAGMTAMPYLTKAKDEAKQASIAAGKYALEKIKSDEDARSAIIAANDALAQELLIKDLEFQQERQLQLEKAQLEGDEAKISEALKNTKQQTLSIGGSDVTIGYGRDVESGGKTVFTTPEPDAREVAAAYKKTGQGINTLRKMEDVLIQIRDTGNQQLGGSALETAIEGLISVGNSMGMNLEYPSGGEVGLKAQFDVLKSKVLLEYKRFMSQETGNGISNIDVKNLQEALGDFDYFTDPERGLMAIREVTEMFERSRERLDPVVDEFMDRSFYSDNEAGDAAYNKVVELFKKQFGNVSLIEPTIVEGENGQVFIDYDIRGI